MNKEIKGGQLFWGTFLLTGGSLFFAYRFEYLPYDWSFIWDVWPVALILMGIIIILKNTVAKPVISVLLGIFVAVIAFGVFAEITFDDYDYHYHSNSRRFESRTEISEDWNENIKFAALEVNTGASRVRLTDPTSDLIKVDARGFLSDYYLDEDISDSSARLELGLVDKSVDIFEQHGSNRLDIKLNSTPVWDITMKMGAAESYLDLGDFAVRRLSLKTGASNTSLVLGDRQERLDLNISIGAAALKIKLPRESGCRIEGEMVLMVKDLDGFNKLGDNYYSTENYESSDNKIEIKIDGGVASLEVLRY